MESSLGIKKNGSLQYNIIKKAGDIQDFSYNQTALTSQEYELYKTGKSPKIDRLTPLYHIVLLQTSLQQIEREVSFSMLMLGR